MPDVAYLEEHVRGREEFEVRESLMTLLAMPIPSRARHDFLTYVADDAEALLAKLLDASQGMSEKSASELWDEAAHRWIDDLLVNEGREMVRLAYGI